MASRDALFDLAVNRALSYVFKRGGKAQLFKENLADFLQPWYLKTRFAYRLSLVTIAQALKSYPREVQANPYHWQGGLKGCWQERIDMSGESQENSPSATTTGGCLCGKVRYEIYGALREVVNCHCDKCRRFHGHYGAYTSALVTDIKIVDDSFLTWYHSTQDETPKVHRGFCRNCGSSLFWHPRDQDKMAIAAGSLDDSRKLKTIGHVWLSQKAAYYQLHDDLLGFDKGWAAMTGSKEE
ncbi:MAG: GFA family protein [Deinococcales bacterium]